MASYLVEFYHPRSGANQLEQASARARAEAAQLSREGRSVRYVRSIFVPEDETCFHLFESSSKEAVLEATERAGFAYARIAEAVSWRARPERKETK